MVVCARLLGRRGVGDSKIKGVKEHVPMSCPKYMLGLGFKALKFRALSLRLCHPLCSPGNLRCRPPCTLRSVVEDLDCSSWADGSISALLIESESASCSFGSSSSSSSNNNSSSVASCV